ncbi:cytochrome c [Bradyrhizobium sp. STM 3562]|jgi:cytochrome c553|uniref:cytochrome c n=1 Tax=Bradyrhizobium sp. STM 3562 TaxID=578924 RepID=UPI00389040B0
MFRATPCIRLLAVAVFWSAPAHVQEAPTFKSLSVDLPSGDAQFRGGPEADAINNNCLACHSADMVLNQPSFPRAVWDAEVHKMIKVYRAPIDEADAARIIDYLANTKGTN